MDNGINVDKLYGWLVALDVSRKNKHKEFVNEYLMNTHQGTTFWELWTNLGNYCNFLNFDLLEHVINKFGSKDLKKKMESYEHDLQSFRKTTRLRDFIDCWPVQGQTPPVRELREFVTKLQHDWDDCTLEHLENLKGVITRKFFLPHLLKEIKDGCVVITWLIPAPFVKALQEVIESNYSEILEQKIEAITIDGEVCYPSHTRKPVDYLKDTVEHEQNERPPVDILHEGLRSFKSDLNKEETLSKEKHKMRLAGETASGGSTSVDSSEVTQFGTHFNLLSSVEQYLSKEEVEADPSLPIKYKNYLSSTPAIREALYTNFEFNAKMSAEVFTRSKHTGLPPPTTMTEFFTAIVLKILVDYLSTHLVYHKQQLKVATFSDLPTDVYQQFQGLCRIAYEGIQNRQKSVFSVADFSIAFDPLGLMQEDPQLYTERRASSYHFIHLTLQEYLAAVHISQLPPHMQTGLFREHLDSGHFKMTFRFLAGLTKLASMPSEVPRKLMRSDHTDPTYFHFLFEAKDISVTTRAQGLDEIVVESHRSWTPLDYYVTGHAISRSSCPWRLNFYRSSINDTKFDLFCQGCAVLGGTGCSISFANFGGNDITFKSIELLVNIPSHILLEITELYMNENELDASACDLLAKTIPAMSKLEELELSGNPVGRGGAVELIKALYGSRMKLGLGNTGIGVPDCAALCEPLKSLHGLFIQGNNFSSESIASIITGISHSSTLTELNISNSQFSMAHVLNLALILRDQSKCTLKWLKLQDCHISEVGACELADALCKNSTLQYLNLNDNPIGVKGASSMSDMLKHNKSLEELKLCGYSVKEGGVRQLIKNLKYNQTLSELWLPWELETSEYGSNRRIRWA